MAFERFLARIFFLPSPHWVLKGGYALCGSRADSFELRLKSIARSTLDLDLSCLGQNGTPWGLPKLEALFDLLGTAAERDLGDFFEFRVSRSGALHGAPEGGLRFSLEALLDGKPLTRFVVDIGQGDPHSTPLEWLPGKVDLSFAGLETPRFPSYPMRDHFAEKLHVYTRPRERKTRVKDLLDLALLIELGVQSDSRLHQCIAEVFATYATHELPNALPLPPDDWLVPFAQLAVELDLNPNDANTWVFNIQTFLTSSTKVATAMLEG